MKCKYLPIYFALLTLLAACDGKVSERLLDEGVSLELAQFRAANYRDVSYDLWFSIPEDKDSRVDATARIAFSLDKKEQLVVDFTGTADDIKTVVLNDVPVEYSLHNQHIVISAKFTQAGENKLAVSFVAGDQSLNRRDDFLYTLLVPDRARTLFPCFDQPDLKASFALTLEVPQDWDAIGNGSVTRTDEAPNGRKTVCSRATEPISTYLFSFVAGKFSRYSIKNDGWPITLYHRETDPAKAAQCREILDEVLHSLSWMKEYTGIPYPFEKYDLIILPGFQYGGMEHMGATLYNDRRMFLEPNATLAERLGRSSLIAHETAHMWFGDYVTMKWFNDVWNKEVFANWFAARIVGPMYPEVNHDLNFILSYFPPAYAEDRTGGAMPIQQHLGNLRDAGLIYSNIVYDKSPIVMDILVRKVGEDKFREAIREYLDTYAYGNADWDGLVAILDRQTDEDLREWSDSWVKQKGMPTVSFEVSDETMTLTQTDPWNRGVEWDQTVEVIFSLNERAIIHHTLDFTESGRVAQKVKYPLLNADSRAYGYFRHTDESIYWMQVNWGFITNEELRVSLLINLYEALMNREIAPTAFLESMVRFIDIEESVQIFIQMLAYAEQCVHLFPQETQRLMPTFEKALMSIADARSPKSVPAIRSFCRAASTEDGTARMYGIWSDEAAAKKYSLGERDLTSLSYELAVRMPDKAAEIVAAQLARITNPDRRKEYGFVSQAVDPSSEKRGAFFRSLLLAENREIEPWVLSALRLLNHPLRGEESLGYIRPALDALRDVQRTGDIFFPANWCSALLSGHISPEALQTVEEFFAQNPGYPELLASKIRLRADHLYVVADRLADRYK